MEYIFVLLLTIFFSFGNKSMSSPFRKVCYAFICILVILILGLRYRVGLDTINYMNTFDRASTLEFLKFSEIFEMRTEPLYTICSSFFKGISKEFWPFQLFMATITTSGIAIFLYRYCRNPFVGLLLYFIICCLYFTTEIIRESAAISIFLLNFENLAKRRWGRYYLFSLLSIGFHYSAVIIWLLPLAKYLKLNIWFIGICCGILFITPLFDYINRVLVFASINNRIDAYLDGNDLNLNWRISQVIQNGLPCICALFFSRKSSLTKSVLRPFVLLQIVFVVAAFAIPIIFQRFINYTQIFNIAFLANVIINKDLRLTTRNVLLCIILLSQTLGWKGMYERWFPYVSVINPKNIQEREYLWREQFMH